MVTTRLPGIYFESVPAPPPALLPRMDIAAFAGFLPSGPIGVPFKVEDPGRFQDVFGTDLALAWDGQAQEMRLAQTPPAVRTFFRNGGQRCWVVRLAKNAQPNTWIIPGLLQIDATGFSAGWVQARSEGSWSDQLTVNATLLENPLPTQLVGWPGSGTSPQTVDSWLNGGDLVQVFYPDTATLAYYDVTTSKWFWFQFAFPSIASSPPSTPNRIRFLGAGSSPDVAFTSFEIQEGEILIGVSRSVASGIAPGSWLEVNFGANVLFAQVTGIDAGLVANSSPPSTEAATLTSTLAWWWLADTAGAWAANRNHSFQASVVTFQLWAWPFGGPVRQISGLAFSPESPFYWGLLPTDGVLYSPVTQAGPLPYAALASQIDLPRFPLAGATTSTLGLPLGMTALVQADFTQAPSIQSKTALERDGLANFDQSLFIDPHLQESDSTTLQQDAFYWQYQAENAGNPKGIHALLGTDEVSMIAAPDAIHSGWELAPVTTDSLAPPDPVMVSLPDESGNYTVSWTGVQNATGYVLDESTDPTFATVVNSRDVGAALSLALSNSTACPLHLYYRAAAYGIPGNGPWSQTAEVLLGTGDFSPCASLPLESPQLQLLPQNDRVLLNWIPAAGPADSFTLQVAEDARFESAHALYEGLDTTFEYWMPPGPPQYFRVNAQRGAESSAWSNTVNSVPQSGSPWQTVGFPNSGVFTAPAVLMAVHMALLVMAAARGDLVAILSLPYPFRVEDAVNYVSLLTENAKEDSERTPSYGALYHPWIVTPDTTNSPPQSLRTLVPDGAVCGVIAATTLSAGSWIAPANIAVNNAVAIDPQLGDAVAEAFGVAQINLISNEPEGFLITNQNTLMTGGNPDLGQLNVRRLLILLRRLALREGVRYMFNNISPALQRAVTRQFEQWMQILLARGAFAGSTVADSYQVIADSTLNSQSSMAQGQFIVQLRIAPSVPLRFLTVQLVQSGGQLTLLET